MLKKGLIVLFIIFLFCSICTISFANNMASDVKNAVGGATNTVVDGVSNLAGDVRNGVQNVGNGIDGALNMDNDNTMLRNNNTNTNRMTDYNATRTGDTTSIAGTNVDTTTMWIWVCSISRT